MTTTGRSPTPTGHGLRLARIPLLAPAILALLAALWGGLLRLGWALPPPPGALAAFHGPLMVSGFLGTLIGLERAAALGRRWTFAAPIATGLGTVALLVGVRGWPGPLLTTLGSGGLVAVLALLIRLQPELHMVTMACGALAWLGGNALWLGGSPIPRVVLPWAGFLVLTIAGERLELTRLLALSWPHRAVFVAATAVLLAGVTLGAAGSPAGVPVAGAGMIALGLWLLRHDLARRTIHQEGLPRFMATCLLSGYVWLCVSGVLALILGEQVAGPYYDAILHALFLGFVFTMIFAHAPVIFPAILGVPIPFRRAFYAHLVLLHATLVVRVSGDLAGWISGRRWGGLLNAATLLLFFASTIGSALRGPGRQASVLNRATQASQN